jgi:hypothetical protein
VQSWTLPVHFQPMGETRPPRPNAKRAAKTCYQSQERQMIR